MIMTELIIEHVSVDVDNDIELHLTRSDSQYVMTKRKTTVNLRLIMIGDGGGDLSELLYQLNIARTIMKLSIIGDNATLRPSDNQR